MRRLLGLLLLLVAVLGALAYAGFQSDRFAMLRPAFDSLGFGPRFAPVALRGIVAQELVPLLEDAGVVGFLKDRYNLQLEIVPAGSPDILERDTSGFDFVWPAGPFALDTYSAQGRPFARGQVALSTPLVIYTWDGVANGLVSAGLASRPDDNHYTLDLANLTAAIDEGKTWSDLGIGGAYGRARITAAHPARSSSGAHFAGLLANTLNGGEPVDDAALASHVLSLRRVYTVMGALPSSGGELFAQYLQQGQAAYPLVVGFEHQLPEFAVRNKQYQPALKERTRVLYPIPTVWASFPLIAFDSRANRLIDAAIDPDFQKLAEARHGFRSGIGGTWRDASALPVSGLAPSIESVVALPDSDVLQRVIEIAVTPGALDGAGGHSPAGQ